MTIKHKIEQSSKHKLLSGVQRGAGGRLLLVLERGRKEMGSESENVIFLRKIVKDLCSVAEYRLK